MDLDELRAECLDCGLTPTEYSTGTTTELRTLLRIMLSADIGREIAYWNMCKSQPNVDGCDNHTRNVFESENKTRHDIRSQQQTELLHTMNHRSASEELTWSSWEDTVTAWYQKLRDAPDQRERDLCVKERG